MLFSVIIVNYKSKSFLKECLCSIEETLSKQKLLNNAEVIIVNNEKSFLKLKNIKKLNLVKIENKKNLGFGKACNIGAKKADGKFLFFLNPDTKLLKIDFNSVSKKFDQNPNLGIIGTQIIKEDSGHPQPWTCGKKTSLLRILLKRFGSQPWNSKTPLLVEWVSGGSLFIKKSDFEKLQGFDKNFFMYFEDQDLCLRMKTVLKKDCLFIPNLKIVHYDGKSWKNDQINQKNNYYKSQEIFFKKHFPDWYFLLFKLAKKTSKK